MEEYHSPNPPYMIRNGSSLGHGLAGSSYLLTKASDVAASITKTTTKDKVRPSTFTETIKGLLSIKVLDSSARSSSEKIFSTKLTSKRPPSPKPTNLGRERFFEHPRWLLGDVCLMIGGEVPEKNNIKPPH